MSAINSLENAFHPRSIAIIGASESPYSPGSPFTRHLIEYGYNGKIYPVNPNTQEVFGIKTYPTLLDIPGFVDYIICCIPASMVLGLLDECPKKKVKVIHLFTGRFSETGIEEASDLEQKILQRAKEIGVRLIGPNCMGVHCPSEGISFGYELPKESGPIGLFSQSGGLALEIIRFAALKNLLFNKAISYGNALDIDETDLLYYFSQDQETEIIACYIEGVKDGAQFFSALKEVSSLKPVVVLKGGKGVAGIKSASSHTGSIAGSTETWDVAIKQAGAIQAEDFEEMINILTGLSFMPPILGRRVGVVGGGGGVSVLSADGWGMAGFDLISLPGTIKSLISERVPEMWWNWIGNPVDVSMMPQSAWTTGLTGDILRGMAESPEFDLVIANVSIGGPFAKNEMISFVSLQADVAIEVAKKKIKPVAAVIDTVALRIEDFETWRWRLLAEQRSRFLAAGIPVFSSISEATRTMAILESYYKRRSSMKSA